MALRHSTLTGPEDVNEIILPHWVDKSVSGTDTLQLPDAKQNGLKTVKSFGKCVQIDAVLPTGYGRLDYVTCTNNCRIDTNIIGNETTVIKARFRVPELQNMYVYACQHSNNTRGITAYITPTVGNWRYGDQTNTLGFEANKWYKTIQSASGISVNGTLYPYGEVNDFDTPYTIMLGVSHSSTGGYGTAYFRGDLGEFSIEKGGVLVANYIPCKNNTTNKYGFYDTVSETFKASETGYSFVAGETLPTPYNPIPIKCNNGEIKVNSQGQVYVDGTTETITVTGTNFNGGTATCENLFSAGEYADEQEVLSGAVTRKVGILILDGTENWGGSSDQNFFTLAKSEITPAPIATVANVLCTHFKNSNSYATTEGRIYLGNTYLNINLNNIGGDKTSQERADFVQWLADKYNSGDPVIVVYPLKEDAPETVLPQSLLTKSGNNSLQITGSLANLGASVLYVGKELTYANYVIRINKLVWASPKLYLTGPVNYEVVGSPTITDGVASGFSGSDYLTLNNDIAANQSFYFKVKFTTSGSTSVYKAILGSRQTRLLTLAQSSSKKLALQIGDTGSAYAAEIFGITTLVPNKQYTAIIDYDKTNFKLYLSENGEDFTEEGTAAYVLQDDITINIGRNWSSSSSFSFGGSIDLKETYIKVNDQLWFYGKNYATQNIAPVPAGYTYGNTTTSAIGYVDMRTQQFTAAPTGATIGRDE